MPAPAEWKIKTTEEGAPMIEGTKITFIDPDGKDVALDPPQMYGKIIVLNKEGKTYRTKAETLQGVADLFDGIDDVPTWKTEAEKALETVKNFNQKDWLKAEKVEKLKSEMALSYDQKLTTQKDSFNDALGQKDNVIASKDSQIHKLLVTNNFAVHPLFGGTKPKTKLSPDIAEAYFGKHFRVEVLENGVELELRAYKDPGKFEDPIYSRENPGEPATFAEAMSELWDKFPGKDALMGATPGGSGASGGTGTGDGDGGDELSRLKKAHAKAQEDGRAKDAIALKNQIFRLEHPK